MGFLSLITGAASSTLTNVKLYLYGALMLLFVLLGFGTYYYHKVYDKEVANFEVLKQQNADLLTKIKQDSAAVIEYKKEADARAKAAADALAAAQKQVRDYERASQDILTAQPTTGNACTSADALFNQVIVKGK